jgi:hypothetical protein
MKPAKTHKTEPTIRLTATLSRPTLVTLPESAEAKIPSGGKMAIEGTINFFPFQATLASDSKGGRHIKLNETLPSVARATVGETVTVEITRAGEEAETRVPTDLRKALSAIPAAQALWEDITPLARRDWIFWIITAKQEETRARRIEKACDKLASGERRVCCFAGINWLMKNGRKET